MAHLYKPGVFEPLREAWVAPNIEPTPLMPFCQRAMGQQFVDVILRRHLPRFSCSIEMDTGLRSFTVLAKIPDWGIFISSGQLNLRRQLKAETSKIFYVPTPSLLCIMPPDSQWLLKPKHAFPHPFRFPLPSSAPGFGLTTLQIGASPPSLQLEVVPFTRRPLGPLAAQAHDTSTSVDMSRTHADDIQRCEDQRKSQGEKGVEMERASRTEKKKEGGKRQEERMQQHPTMTSIRPRYMSANADMSQMQMLHVEEERAKESSSCVVSGSRDFVQGFMLPGEAEKAAKILESFLGLINSAQGIGTPQRDSIFTLCV
ncbi:hypothetical protein DFH29DRAFT_1001332 [Suillus ampliporus]|nr:hypothetical protein DFH29DRAFT_1001332 [Suillus ampliporus]